MFLLPGHGVVSGSLGVEVLAVIPVALKAETTTRLRTFGVAPVLGEPITYGGPTLRVARATIRGCGFRVCSATLSPS